ncbi:thiol:disulfide interchange protein DsbA/DsbL [Thiomicrorhabdus sp. ZW0627]|uniref:thiol:disulfide interchange protein DsbA/DsbL n=1 Tax=Thiomicrorhabdus sp. ZW0627 TaxID=3039774 RepID=UPI002436DCC6|nr:thiol:disulfide interchange protein DsbA/DsbL [Thiomicrorhabdus sp. ZW0627]MDG6774234.1 thiol:disulfide interchange protein DsbA/DsbL [Thiomicrorhabdus sp. ZW0627]
MLRRTWLKTLAAGAFIALFSNAAIAQQEDFGFEEGVEYKKIPQPVSIAPHNKQVTEVFYYGCPHCYHLEPSIHGWLKTKPEDVYFEQVPAVLNNPNWIFMAKVYYTAKELGVLKQSHTPFFDALHRDKKPLFTVKAIAKFFTQFGVKEKDFESTFNSFKVDQLVRNAIKVTKSYGIDGVPAVIVNGKYITDVPMTHSQKRMWNVVDYLTNK